MASRASAQRQDRVTGWWVFAGVLLAMSGVLNVIWGIAAISDSKFFVNDATYILEGLHTWGWVTLVLGAIELIAGFSLFTGGGFGRWLGIFAAGLSAIAALMSISAYPFWSLAIFALSVIILYQLSTAPERGTY